MLLTRENKLAKFGRSNLLRPISYALGKIIQTYEKS
jgi:hypothetical protein